MHIGTCKACGGRAIRVRSRPTPRNDDKRPTSEQAMEAAARKRWTATITWRDAHGHIMATEVRHIEEIAELGHFIEGGPDWTQAVNIRIELAYRKYTRPAS